MSARGDRGPFVVAPHGRPPFATLRGLIQAEHAASTLARTTDGVVEVRDREDYVLARYWRDGDGEVCWEIS